jgi:hypothetical protein
MRGIEKRKRGARGERKGIKGGNGENSSKGEKRREWKSEEKGPGT